MLGVAKEIIKVLHGDVDASKYIEHVTDRKINDLRCSFIICCSYYCFTFVVS